MFSAFPDVMHSSFPFLQLPDRQTIQVPTAYHQQLSNSLPLPLPAHANHQQQQQQQQPQTQRTSSSHSHGHGGHGHHQQQQHQTQAAAPPPKDVQKPKGRMSAYTYFVQMCRDQHRQQFPNENANFSEFSKKCAEKWKTMTESEKCRFVAQADVDKQRFDREMAIYAPGEKAKKKKMPKDPLAPRRPLSAFFHYCGEERPKLKAINPSLSVGEIAKELGDRWNKTGPEGKHMYEEMAQQDKIRYEKEMVEFKQSQKKAPPPQTPSTPSSAAKSSPATSSPSSSQQQQQMQQQQHHHSSEQQQQQQEQQQQQQQYSSQASYQIPQFNPMQSFPPQSFAQMNNHFQDPNVLAASLFPHYNGYSLPMASHHSNASIQQQQATAAHYQQQLQHLQQQTYQALAHQQQQQLQQNSGREEQRTNGTNKNNNNNNNELLTDHSEDEE